MKPVDQSELLGLAEYEAIREPFRARIIGEKKLRRLQVGPKATLVFENRETVLLQIQEMLRTERITRPAAIQHEVATYGELVPGKDELSVTLMIEVEDRDERDAFLRAALGFERHVWFSAGSERIRARSIDRGEPSDRTTAVHYLKFDLPAALADKLRDPATARSLAPAIEVDHPAYAARSVLSAPTLAQLAEDLAS